MTDFFFLTLLQPITKGLESDDIQVAREALEVSPLYCETLLLVAVPSLSFQLICQT